VGKDYASTLSSIKERQAVFFGRGSSCENPVLLKLNDRDEFRNCFRRIYPPFIPLPSLEESTSATSSDETITTTSWDDFDDDIPY
jgi:hypothetical protein